MQKEGSIKTVDKIYHYRAELTDKPDKKAINGGRIIKLSVTFGGNEVIAYDKGWHKKAAGQEENAVLCILLYSCN